MPGMKFLARNFISNFLQRFPSDVLHQLANLINFNRAHIEATAAGLNERLEMSVMAMSN